MAAHHQEILEVAGLSVLSYLNRFRCIQAQKLLHGGMAVKMAAMACGFEPPSYFTRIYKRHVGRLPSEERNKQQEKSEAAPQNP